MAETIRPRRIRLEASSDCQLRCSLCPQTTGAIAGAVGRGYLKVADFDALAAANPWLREVELSNLGEIFLNPELPQIVEAAHRRDVALSADTGANMNRVEDDALDALVRYRFRRITVSLDGASDETYPLYRRGGSFDAVVENIRKLNDIKRRNDSRYPALTWQFVVFGHNEHEIPKARAMARGLGMDFRLKPSWDPGFSPLRDGEFVQEQHRLSATRQGGEEREPAAYSARTFCHQMWEEPQINWDGRVFGCCCNYWGDFGANAFEDGLLESLNCEKMVYARSMLLGREVARGDLPCAACDTYLMMRKHGAWLRRGSGRALYRAARFGYRTLKVRRLQQKMRQGRDR